MNASLPAPDCNRAKRPLRVLHISTTINRGGAENHLADLIEGQVSKGLEVGCAYLKGDAYWAKRLVRLGVPITDLRMRFNGAPAPIFRLRKLICAYKPDIVHAHGTHAEFYGYLARCALADSPPLVISRHEERLRLFRVPGFSLFDRVIARAAKKFIAISHAVKRADVARVPKLAEKMEVVHYGFDIPNSDDGDRCKRAFAIRDEWQVPTKALLVVTLARMVPEKSLDTLIRAFADFSGTRDSAGARLAIVGKGPLEAQLRQLARQLDVDQSIVWAGFREDVVDILEASDVFVLSSTCEGFGLVLLEAMAAALPIVASRTSAIPEIVLDGETGLLFAPRDWRTLAKHLSRLADSAELRERLGRAGLKRLVEDFQVDEMIEQTVDIYFRTHA